MASEKRSIDVSSSQKQSLEQGTESQQPKILTEEDREELLEIAGKITQKLQELKILDQSTTSVLEKESQTEISEQHTQLEDQSTQSLSTQSTEKKPEESHQESDIKQESSQSKEIVPEQPSSKEGEQRVPLVDLIIGKVQAVSDNIHKKVEEIKDVFKVRETPPEKVPMVDKVAQKIHNISDKISHNVESVQGIFKSIRKKRGPEESGDLQENEESNDIQEEENQSHVRDVAEDMQMATCNVAENIEALKDESKPKTSESVSGKASEDIQQISCNVGENVEAFKEKVQPVSESEASKGIEGGQISHETGEELQSKELSESNLVLGDKENVPLKKLEELALEKAQGDVGMSGGSKPKVPSDITNVQSENMPSNIEGKSDNLKQKSKPNPAPVDKENKPLKNLEELVLEKVEDKENAVPPAF